MERMTSPNYRDAREPLVQTVAIIQPQCMYFRDEITKRIADAGFTILQRKIVQLTNDQVAELFADQKHAENFSLMQKVWTAGPILVMCLTKPKAIDQLKALLGSGTVNDANPLWPGCLRAQYASDDILIGVHGSDDIAHFRHEINFFFPDIIVEPLSRQNQESYLKTQIYPTLMNALYQVAKDRPVDPIFTLATTLLETNPNRPHMEPACDATQLLNEIDEMEMILNLDDELPDDCDEFATYRKHGRLPVIIETEEEVDELYRSM